MSAYKKEWEVIVLVERSYKGGGAAFKVLNIGDSVVYRTKESE